MLTETVQEEKEAEKVAKLKKEQEEKEAEKNRK